MTVKFTNNASTTIGTGINASATSLTVASASSFPQLSGADDYCYLTLQGATSTTREVVKATALSSNTFTIVRAQDNTSAASWVAGDIVELRMTAALLTDVIDAATVEGVKTNFQYTPTAGQTVFSGADNASNTLIINQAALVSVYLNGIRLVQGSDYSVSSANNTVTLTAGVTTADIVDVEVFGNFTGQSGAAVAITGGAISGASVAATTLSASGTATLNTFVSSNATISGGTINNVNIGATTAGTGRFSSITTTGSVTADALTANGSSEGDTYFTGGTANSRLLNVFTSTHDGSANAGHNFKIASGQGAFIFGNATTANLLKVQTGGIAVSGSVTADGLTSSGAVTIDPADGVADDAYALSVRNNEATDGRNYGLWVRAGSNSSDESFSVRNHDNSATYFKVRGDGNVGIGETSPLGKLHIKGSDTGATASAQGNSLVLEDTENGLSILSSTAGAGYINFGDSDDNDVGMIIYGHSSNAMNFWTNAAERMRIDSAGDARFAANATGAALIKGVSGDQTSRNSGGYPQFTFVGNEGTGIRRPSANVLAFDASGDEAMRIADNGNVGIGDAPSSFTNAALHVAKDMGNSITAVARLRGRNTTARTTRLQFEDYAGAIADGLIDFHFPNAGSHTNAYFGMGYNTSTHLAINVNGQVGAGTTTPTQARLVAHTASGMSIAATKDNTGASISLGGVTQPRVLIEAEATASGLKIYGATGSSYSSPNWVVRAHFNSSGHLVVGSSSHADDVLYLVRSGSGKLQRFYVGSDEQGWIGAANGDLNINGGPSEHSGIRFQATSVLPRHNNADSNGAVDLGLSSNKWKNIYASGALYALGIWWQNDTDTGMYRDDTNSISFRVGGNDYLTIDGDNTGYTHKIRNGTYTWIVGTSGNVFNFYDGAGNQRGYVNTSGFQNGSDVAFKENIVDINRGLAEVLQLKPRKFDIKDSVDMDDEDKVLVGDKDALGFIAQEMEAAIPELVNGEDGSKTIGYAQLTAVLTKAIQEQQTLIESLTDRIAALENN